MLLLRGTIETGAGKFTHVRQLPPQSFQIVKVDLKDNRHVTDDNLEQLKGLTKLEGFILFGREITDAGLQQLQGLTKLTKLDLQETKVTPQGIADLKQALPKCEITGP